MSILRRKAKPKTATPKKIVNSTTARRAKKTVAYPENKWAKVQTAEGWKRDRLLEM